MKPFLLLAAALAIASSAVAAPEPFRDVPKGHWAYGAVQRLAGKQILGGFSDDTFRGDKPLTRYSFAVALAKAFEGSGGTSGVPPSASSPGSGRHDPARPAGSRASPTMGTAERRDLEALVTEFDAELDLLGVKVGAIGERLSAQKRQSDELAARVAKLEQGDAAPVRFRGGELRLAGYNKSARSSQLYLLLGAEFNSGANLSGKLDLQYRGLLDGRLNEGIDAYEAYADLKGLGGPLERLRAGRFNYLLGAGLVLYDRVEGFDLSAGHGRNHYEALYGDDLILEVDFPTFAGGQMGYYYIKQGINSTNAQPFHAGAFLRGKLGDRFRYGFEFSDYDNSAVTPANFNRRTRAFLSDVELKLGSRIGLEAATIVQEEDFRAFSIDHDLVFHNRHKSPLEDVLQTLDTFSDGATATKNEINGLSDYKLGIRFKPGEKTSLFAGLDDVGPHATLFDTSRDAFRIWTASFTRSFGKADAAFELRLRRLVFEHEDPLRVAGTLPIARHNGGEIRAQYFTRF